MDEIARQMNEALKGTVAYDLLSDMGKRIYFPRGIVAQSAEAKAKATRFNATIGQAIKDGQPMYLSDIWNQFKGDAFKPMDIFAYAPGGGVQALREAWKADMLVKNPSLKGKHITLPLVTAGLTHTLSIVSLLFSQEGDTLVLPDLAWDNYELMYTALNHASIKTFPLYDEAMSFNIAAMVAAIRSIPSKKARILLNFPNNPTGYTPSTTEMDLIAAALKGLADEGYQLLVVSDDAYYGLFYEPETAKESLFARLCDASPNILAVKGDAATKEAMVWGFRIAFVTYGCKGMTDEQYAALDNKTRGMIRATVSNCDHPGQTLLLHAMQSPSYRSDKRKVLEEMRGRYDVFHAELKKHENQFGLLRPYPFNSGYFMSFATKGDAEQLRLHLLDRYGTGCINIAGRVLRVAYCSVEKQDIPALIDTIYQAAEDIWN